MKIERFFRTLMVFSVIIQLEMLKIERILRTLTIFLAMIEPEKMRIERIFRTLTIFLAKTELEHIQRGGKYPNKCPPEMQHCNSKQMLPRNVALQLQTLQRESHPESCSIKPNLDCNHTFSIYLVPNKNLFVGKSIGKV